MWKNTITVFLSFRIYHAHVLARTNPTSRKVLVLLKLRGSLNSVERCEIYFKSTCLKSDPITAAQDLV